jgi:cell division protein FtsQ
MFRKRTNRRRTRPGAQAVRGLGVVASAAKLKARLSGRLLLRALPYALIALIVALAPLVIITGYRYVTEAEEFGVRSVDVSGHDHVTVSELLDVAGVKDAPNLLALDLDEVEARVAAHPWVRAAKVERHLPDKLSISVIERKPMALVALGALYLVDRKGNVFARVQAGEHFDLPVLTGLFHEDLSPNAAPERFLLSRRMLRGALRLLQAWRQSQAGKGVQVSEIHIDPLFGYSFVLGEGAGVGEGALIRLGRGEIDAKLDRLTAVLTHAGNNGKRVAEVRLNDERDPTRVAVRFRTETKELDDKDGDSTGDADRRGEPSGRS